MKAKNCSLELIRSVLDKYENREFNMAAPVARQMLADDVHAELSKHYHIFKKNELLVNDTTDLSGCGHDHI